MVKTSSYLLLGLSFCAPAGALKSGGDESSLVQAAVNVHEGAEAGRSPADSIGLKFASVIGKMIENMKPKVNEHQQAPAPKKAPGLFHFQQVKAHKKFNANIDFTYGGSKSKGFSVQTGGSCYHHNSTHGNDHVVCSLVEGAPANMEVKNPNKIQLVKGDTLYIKETGSLTGLPMMLSGFASAAGKHSVTIECPACGASCKIDADKMSPGLKSSLQMAMNMMPHNMKEHVPRDFQKMLNSPMGMKFEMPMPACPILVEHPLQLPRMDFQVPDTSALPAMVMSQVENLQVATSFMMGLKKADGSRIFSLSAKVSAGFKA